MTHSLQFSNLKNLQLPFPLDYLPDPVYLVGGAVRDALVNRQSDRFDFDLVLPRNAVTIAQDIAKKTQGGFVLLDPQRQIARVVYAQGTVDFAQQEGPDLETDLQRRDYRVNAIAYDFLDQRLIDPLDGCADLRQGQLNMIARHNLEADPLRLLRAYRQGAQLNLAITPETRKTLIALAPLIATVAAERVQAELNYLLTAPGGNPWLRWAVADGILQPWLPSITSDRLDQLASLTPNTLVQDYPAIAAEPQWLALAKLCCLVNPNPHGAEQELQRLKYSNWDLKGVLRSVRAWQRWQYLPGSVAPPELTIREQYFLFLELGIYAPILLFLLATQPHTQGLVKSLGDRFFNPQDPVAHPQPLVSGGDLIQGLRLKPGPRIGELLTEIQVKHLEGQLTNKEEAIAWAARQR